MFVINVARYNPKFQKTKIGETIKPETIFRNEIDALENQLLAQGGAESDAYEMLGKYALKRARELGVRDDIANKELSAILLKMKKAVDKENFEINLENIKNRPEREMDKLWYGYLSANDYLPYMQAKLEIFDHTIATLEASKEALLAEKKKAVGTDSSDIYYAPVDDKLAKYDEALSDLYLQRNTWASSMNDYLTSTGSRHDFVQIITPDASGRAINSKIILKSELPKYKGYYLTDTYSQEGKMPIALPVKYLEDKQYQGAYYDGVYFKIVDVNKLAPTIAPIGRSTEEGTQIDPLQQMLLQLSDEIRTTGGKILVQDIPPEQPKKVVRNVIKPYYDIDPGEFAVSRDGRTIYTPDPKTNRIVKMITDDAYKFLTERGISRDKIRQLRFREEEEMFSSRVDRLEVLSSPMISFPAPTSIKKEIPQPVVSEPLTRPSVSYIQQYSYLRPEERVKLVPRKQFTVKEPTGEARRMAITEAIVKGATELLSPIRKLFGKE